MLFNALSDVLKDLIFGNLLGVYLNGDEWLTHVIHDSMWHFEDFPCSGLGMELNGKHQFFGQCYFHPILAKTLVLVNRQK